MPWSTTTPMDQRARFIFDLERCCYTMTELCQHYGVSRKTGYKWAQRYVDGGIEGLSNQSRAPRDCPHRTPQAIRDALISFRRKHPTWGPKKLRRVLSKRHPEVPWPALSTIGNILSQAGLVVAQRRRRRSQPLRASSAAAPGAPNELWSADFKGQFLTGDRRYCYPLTIVDRYSRLLLRCEGLKSTAGAGVSAGFQSAFREFGLPDAILTDNGTPFAGSGLRGLSRLAVWWIRLGIRPIRIAPGRPQQNGGHERMHRTLKAETTRPPARNLRAQQDRFDAFVQEYNVERPHESLGQQWPAELYRPADRPYPEQLPEVEYPGHYELRKVRHTGEIKWKGARLFLSETLAGEQVGLEETDDGIWSLYFSTILLARYDERDRKLT